MAPFEAERDTREQLLRAARDLLLDEGLAGLSMRKVAAECGLSAPAIYRHFEDKDALLAAAIQKGARLFSSYLMTALAAPTPRERLMELGQRYFRFAVENPRDYELIFIVRCETLGRAKASDGARADSDLSFRLLVDRVAECQRSGDLREGPTEAIAVSIWSSMHGIVSLALSGHLGTEPERAGDLFDFQQAAILRAFAA